MSFSIALQAQEAEGIYHRLTISFKSNGTTQTTHTRLTGTEAANFDVAAYLQQNISKGHIKIHGDLFTDLMVTKYRFDSDHLLGTANCFDFCQTVVKEDQVPVLGVSVDHTSDFEGVWIKRTLTNTAASSIGLSYGDVITHIDENTVNSGCDLRTTIRQYKAGEEIHVAFERDGQNFRSPTQLSFQTVREVSWKNCCNETETPAIELSTFKQQQLQLFPNPTDGRTQVIFNSTDKGNFEIYITDVSGRELYREEVTTFDGYYKKQLDLSDQPAGIYFLNVVQGGQIQTEKIILQKL